MRGGHWGNSKHAIDNVGFDLMEDVADRLEKKVNKNELQLPPWTVGGVPIRLLSFFIIFICHVHVHVHVPDDDGDINGIP